MWRQCSQPPGKDGTCTDFHLYSIFHAEVLQSIVTFKPASLTVLVKADSDDVEVLDEDGEDLQGLAKHHVEATPLLLQLAVQVFQALQQERHLVEFAKPEQNICFHLTPNCYLVVGVSPSKMKSGRSFVSGSAAAAARLRKLFEKIIQRKLFEKKKIKKSLQRCWYQCRSCCQA